MFLGKKIMVVVAHPDDELLGLGASMHKLIAEKNVVTHVVILGEGITSRSKTRDRDTWSEELKEHKSDIVESQKIIGYHNVSVYDFPDNRFDTVPLLDIIKVIEDEKQKFMPDIIFTHHGGDLNVDHRITFEAVVTASRPMEDESVKTIITFETLSGTEWQASVSPLVFRPNLYIEVSKSDVEFKQKAMQQYKFEVRNFPHPRSIESIKIKAESRGTEVGCNYAEAFCIIRKIEK